ncbi:hypothetical protein ACOMHN_004130 [Nucella lapillus]
MHIITKDLLDVAFQLAHSVMVYYRVTEVNHVVAGRILLSSSCMAQNYTIALQIHPRARVKIVNFSDRKTDLGLLRVGEICVQIPGPKLADDIPKTTVGSDHQTPVQTALLTPPASQSTAETQSSVICVSSPSASALDSSAQDLQSTAHTYDSSSQDLQPTAQTQSSAICIPAVSAPSTIDSSPQDVPTLQALINVCTSVAGQLQSDQSPSRINTSRPAALTQSSLVYGKTSPAPPPSGRRPQGVQTMHAPIYSCPRTVLLLSGHNSSWINASYPAALTLLPSSSAADLPPQSAASAARQSPPASPVQAFPRASPESNAEHPQFETLVDYLEYMTEHRANDTAFVFRKIGKPPAESCRLSWEDVYIDGLKFAEILKKAHIKDGALVLNTLPNSAERLVCEVGILLAGAVSVNGYTDNITELDLKQLLLTSLAPYIIVRESASQLWGKVRDFREVKYIGPGCVITTGFCYRWMHAVVVGRQFLTSVQNTWVPVGYEIYNARPDDACFLERTSGTSGFIKLKSHSHASVMNGLVYRLAGALPIGGHRQEQCVEFVIPREPVPMAGLQCNVLVGSCTKVFLDQFEDQPLTEAPSVEDILKIIDEEGVSRATVDVAWLSLMRSEILKPGQSHLKRIRQLDCVRIGMHPVTSDMLASAFVFAKTVVVFYRVTECVDVVAWCIIQHVTDLPQDNILALRVNPQIKVKIVNWRDRRSDIGLYASGEICLKSPLITPGYVQDVVFSAEAFTPDGYFRTGDRGHLLHGGALVIEGSSQRPNVHSSLWTMGSHSALTFTAPCRLWGPTAALRSQLPVDYGVPQRPNVHSSLWTMGSHSGLTFTAPCRLCGPTAA